jgi:hypothetical protein
VTQKGPEAILLEQVIDTAGILGWEAVHFRPARTSYGWRTPVQGSMGKGWPDLILVRGARVMAVELKADGKRPTPEQMRVLDLLERAGIDTRVWSPKDWEHIVAALR